ncbi:hypothetical protein IWQ56_007320 [Coemansia nantahalensis]|uniref:Uncharacterized protein n=2 Tax=Coemansia TaxID=4863 RepID=A0ACC1L9Y9_9FUNG|nr:hypothetical protein IWQ56_007320 [Coemansia nantahalensis]KAJ2769225.1 hypothetical protein IWQ57_003194 [Coemansia nantahalensis]KAJ2804380.1 hypothetical protein H4R21_001665 [Coemansia helicoidea]
MKLNLLAALLAGATAVAAWTFPQKLGVYSMIQRLAQAKTGSVDERIIYGKLAMFFGDWRTSAWLSSTRESQQYRNALLTLVTDINTVRSDAINDPNGVENLEYIIRRIRFSFQDSLAVYYGGQS